MTRGRRTDPRPPPVTIGNRTSPPFPCARAQDALDAITGPLSYDAEDCMPATRGECIDGPRPCPHVSCRHHLAISVTRFGGLQITWPTLEIGEVVYSCSLDVADEHGGLILDDIGEILNITRERVRQIERRALDKIAASGKLRGYRETP